MKQEKKIVRIFSRLNIGGPTIHVVNLTRDLEKFGWKTILVTGRVLEGEGSFSSYADTNNVRPHIIAELQAPIHPIKDLIALYKIWSLLRREKPNIVHTHTFKAGLLGRLAAVLSGTPFIVHTYHGHLLNGYWGRIGSFLIRRLEGALNRLTHKILVVSQRVGHELMENGVVEEKNLRTMELGFDIDLFDQNLKKESKLRWQLNIPDGAYLIGLVGRMVPVKDFELALNSLETLLKARQDIHVVLIGDGPLRQKLESQTKDLGLTEQVHFAGWVLPLIPELNDIDLVVCSSKNEGTSVAIIEAILAGRPVISTAVGGMSDLLDHGRFGVLVPPRQLDLSQALQNWAKTKPINGRSRNQVCITESSKEFRRRFSLDRLTLDMNRIYEEFFPNA